MTTQKDAEASIIGSTNRSLVGTFFHQTEELLCGAMVTILLIQLLYCGQQLIDNGLQLRTAYCLTTQKVDNLVKRFFYFL